MAVGTLDQHQDSGVAAFGFGQFAGARYRGQVWTAGLSGSLGSIGFNRDTPSNDIKVYIDTVDGSNNPAHAIGSELYSWVIPVASITGGYQVFDLPVPLAGIVNGTKYCFYLAPFSGGVYADDYHDCHGIAATTGGVTEITNSAGSWASENLCFHYAVYVITGSRNSNFFTFFSLLLGLVSTASIFLHKLLGIFHH